MLVNETMLFYFTSAFIMGLLGSVHCIGMCGGIVCAFTNACSTKKTTNKDLFYFQLTYSMGRLLTYALLGAMIGLFGMMTIQHFGSHYGLFLRYLTSILMILVGFYLAGWTRVISSLESIGQYLWKPMSKLTSYLLPIKHLYSAFALGSLWGLLPCGLVYSALFYSLTTGSPALAASTMFCFGLGTLPALLLVGSAMQRYHLFLSQQWLKYLSGLTMIGFGLSSFIMLFFHVQHFKNLWICLG
jgi:sulfite exporter TauE/SafE